MVTGTAGFIGTHLVERLLELGYGVVGVDAFTGYYSRDRECRNLALVSGEDDFLLVRGDLLDLDGLSKPAAEELVGLYARQRECRPRSCATSPSTVPASGPTWRSHASSRWRRGEPLRDFGEGSQAREMTTYVSDAVEATAADLDLVEREPGYRPRVGLEEGIRTQVEWARDEEPVTERIGGFSRGAAR